MALKFSKVNIEISNICNLQCSFCPEVEREKGRMSRSLFETIIQQVAPFTKLVALHLMGDPLVHPELREFIEICDANGVRVFVVTNGVLLREKEVETLLHSAIRQVNFSLHSFTDNFGNRDMSTYLGKIFDYTERAFAERPTLFINYRLWNLQTKNGTHEHHLELLERIEARFGVNIPREWDVTQKKSFKVKNLLYLHFDTEFDWPKRDLPILGTTGTCYGLSSHFGVLVDGTVVPCCLDKEGDIPLGKISERPLKDILEDSRAKKMLAGFKAGLLVEELCKRCQYIERFQ